MLKDDAHKSCLETVSAQPGCLAVTWDILNEDPTALVWLVEWETLEDHTERFVKSEGYAAFSASFDSFLSTKDTVIFFGHFNFSPPPSQVLQTSSRPTLELFSLSLRHFSEYEAFMNAMSPIVESWRAADRPYALARAADPDSQSKVMFVVAWESVDAHYAAKRDPAFQKAINNARAMWHGVNLFGHITPSEG